MSDALSARYLEASLVLASVRDVVAERALGPGPPSWCERRGWTGFLERLEDAALLTAERGGLPALLDGVRDAPRELVELADVVRHLTALPIAPRGAADDVAVRRASPRKRAQVTAFSRLIEPLARDASRIVDVGSGHGHLTRHLARSVGVPVHGWEREPERVAVARALSGDDGRACFAELDARIATAELGPGDLAVGLHACGELGDALVRAAGDAGVAVALVACCPQKRIGDRAALAAVDAPSASALRLGRAELGLANVRDGEQGVEHDLATRNRARLNRIALGALLRAAGRDVRPGEEMRGLNRRRAVGALEDLAARAFVLRGLAPPSSSAVAAALVTAATLHARMRRWELPRTLLARLIEVWVALDRAQFLALHGHAVDVVLVFDREVSPRNVALLARPRESELRHSTAAPGSAAHRCSTAMRTATPDST